MGRWVLAVLACSAAAQASTAPCLAGDVLCTVQTSYDKTPAIGYAPVWVELENTSNSSQIVTLVFDPMYDESTTRRDVTVQRGEKRTVLLPVPGRAGTGELRASAKGRTQRTAITIGQATIAPALVIGTDQELREAAHATEGDLATLDALHVEPSHAPDTLAGYAGRGGVVVLRPMTELAVPQRTALQQYVLAGGFVLVPGATSLAEWFPSTGFGRASGCDAHCIDELKTMRVDTVWEGESATPYEGQRDDETKEARRELAGVGTAPVGAFLLLILAFALFVGPGSIVLAQRHGRAVVLLTIPLAALVTCLGIAGWAVISDGLFTVHESGRGAVWLDPASDRAAMLVQHSLFAALGPGRVEIPAGCALLNQHRSPDAIDLDWSNGLAAGGSFLPSRSARRRFFACVRPSRLRITRDGDRLLNALDATITGGLVTLGGTPHAFRKTPPGQVIGNKDAKGEEREGFAALCAAAVVGLGTDSTRRIACAIPDEGEYVALVDDLAIAPLHALGTERHPSRYVVRGRLR